MHVPSRDFIIRRPGGDVWLSDTLVLGPTLRVAEHNPSGLPELSAGGPGEVVLLPSGGDDTDAIQAALDTHSLVRLGPGSFQASRQLVLRSGVALVGSGSRHTEVCITGSEHGIYLGHGSEDVRVEGLTLTGPGLGGALVHGIVAWWEGATPVATRRVRLRELVVRDFADAGIVLGYAVGVQIDGVTVTDVGHGGVSLLGQQGEAGQSALRGVRLRNVGTLGVYIEHVSQVELSSLDVDGAPSAGVWIENAAEVRLSTAVLRGCWAGVGVVDTAGLSLENVKVEGCDEGFWLERVTGASLAACRTAAIGEVPLRIQGGRGCAVSAFASDQTAQSPFADHPHLVVSAGATQVALTGFLRTNSPGGTLTWEADVSAAGGRVVFVQHELTPAKVSSGGKFVAL